MPTLAPATTPRRYAAAFGTIRRMPIYTYRCDACDTTRDVRHSMHADPETTCPDCSGPVRKVIHAAGIAFKGSGFYRTDHIAAPPPKPAKARARR